jgi:DNA-binding NarL/FixJ family response regulator
MTSIRIAIVDDHEVVRQGLRLSLELEADMTVVGEARTGAEAIDLARQRQPPDVMLLDVRLGDLDGPEVCRRVLDVAPRTAVVMLTNYLQDGLVFRSLAAGAKGYVIRPQ